MDFSLPRHLRLAGAVTTIAGVFLDNFTIVLLGNLIIAVGYMWSIAIIEKHVENVTAAKEERKENL